MCVHAWLHKTYQNYTIHIAAAPGSVSNIMVIPSVDGTLANITWSAAPLFDANTDVTYSVVVRDMSETTVWMGNTINLIAMVTGLGEYLTYLMYTVDVYICNISYIL